jgi:ferredoxin
MAYERAEEIVRAHTDFAVRNCVCRQERQALGKGCDKPLEMCLSFDSGALYTVSMGRGRSITKEEALALLKQADQAGLVLQPANSQNPIFICACCGCCCGVLRGLALQPNPADLVANPFIASLDADACSSCGTCAERCQMGAITLGALSAELDLARCIGCGLCVSTCPSGAVVLVRKPAEQQTAIPKNTLNTYLQLSQARANGGPGRLLEMMLKSKLDRFVAPR